MSSLLVDRPKSGKRMSAILSTPKAHVFFFAQCSTQAMLHKQLTTSQSENIIYLFTGLIQAFMMIPRAKITSTLSHTSTNSVTS